MNSVEILIVCNRVNVGQFKKNNLYTQMTFTSGVTGSVTLINGDKKMVGYKGVVSVCDIIREVRPCDW